MNTTPVTNGNGRGEVLMEKRQQIRLERVEGDKNRMEKEDALIVWFDTAGLSAPTDGDRILERIVNAAYTGVLLHADNVAALAPVIPARFVKVLHALSGGDFARLAALPDGGAGFVVASPDLAILAEAAKR